MDMALSARPQSKGNAKYRIKRHSKRNMLRDGALLDDRVWTKHADPPQVLLASISADRRAAAPLSSMSQAWSFLESLLEILHDTLDHIGEEMMPALSPSDFDNGDLPSNTQFGRPVPYATDLTIFMADVPRGPDPLQLLLDESMSSLQRSHQPGQSETNQPQRRSERIDGEQVEHASGPPSSPTMTVSSLRKLDRLGNVESDQRRSAPEVTARERKVSFGGVVSVSQSGPRLENNYPEILFNPSFSPSMSQTTGSGGNSIHERRRGNRGSFELDEASQRWVTPKATPSVSTAGHAARPESHEQSMKLAGNATSFEDLKKSLRMTPIVKPGESMEAAGERVSSLQRPRRPSEAEFEQQHRKDSGGNGETQAFMENSAPAFQFTISSLGSDSSHGLPRSPPPRAKHRRSGAIALGAQEQQKLDTTLQLRDLLMTARTNKPQRPPPDTMPSQREDDEPNAIAIAIARAKATATEATHAPPILPSARAGSRSRRTPGAGVPAGPRAYGHTLDNADQEPDGGVPLPSGSLPALGAEKYHFREDGVLINPRSLEPIPPPPPIEEEMNENPRISGYAQHYGRADFFAAGAPPAAPRPFNRHAEMEEMRRSFLPRPPQREGEIYQYGPASGVPMRLTFLENQMRVAAEAEAAARNNNNNNNNTSANTPASALVQNSTTTQAAASDFQEAADSEASSSRASTPQTVYGINDRIPLSAVVFHDSSLALLRQCKSAPELRTAHPRYTFDD